MHFDQIIKVQQIKKTVGIETDADSPLCTTVYADDQLLTVETEEHLQKGVLNFNHILELYNTRISENKSKVMEMRGKYIREKL
jgi:hypothetical protein